MSNADKIRALLKCIETGDPRLADGASAWQAALSLPDEAPNAMRCTKRYRILAEGDVVLSQCEGRFGGAYAALYDLYRLDADCIVEHWNTVEHIAPRSEWNNDIGKL